MNKFCIEIKKYENEQVELKTIFENFVNILSNFEKDTIFQEKLANKSYLNDYNEKLSILIYKQISNYQKKIYVIITEYKFVVEILYLCYLLKEKNPMISLQLIDSNVFVFEFKLENEIPQDTQQENFGVFCQELYQYMNRIGVLPNIVYTEFCQKSNLSFYNLLKNENLLDEVNYYFNIGC